MRVRAAAINVANALLALTSAAHVDDDRKPTARLEDDRTGATMCPDASALTDAVAGRLGYDPFVPSGGSLRIIVRFTRNAAGVSGQVEAFDASGDPKGAKTIASKRGDCVEVAQAVTLTIALLLDPRGGLVARSPPSKADPDPLAPVVDAPPLAPPRRRSYRAHGRASSARWERSPGRPSRRGSRSASPNANGRSTPSYVPISQAKQ